MPMSGTNARRSDRHRAGNGETVGGEPPDGRQVRIAAVGDLHMSDDSRGGYASLFARVNQESDILALVGDITTHGKPEQMRAFVEDIQVVEKPMVAVLGNHDHESDNAEQLTDILTEAGVHVLDGNTVEIEGVGFAGTKGFAGGFGRGSLAPFGEKLIKDFVQHAIDEALKLENALRQLETSTRVVLLHYAPVIDTLEGEPQSIYPFLGSSRLLTPIDTLGADVVFHGHAHHGTFEGRTPAGIPVYNVAYQILAARDEPFFLWRARAPERRQQAAPQP